MRMIDLGWGAVRARMGRRAAMALTACLLLGAGCVQNSDPETDAEPKPTTYVRVENRSFQDMTIYVYRNSAQRIRLGQATANSVTRLVVPSLYVNGPTPLRFQADPLGGSRTPIAEEITVSPGDEIVLTIPN